MRIGEQRDDVVCGECGQPMILRSGRHGLFYGCSQFPACKATHGAHPDGEPLGVPADGATRAARIVAHNAFDQLWQGMGAPMNRAAAYLWMQRELGRGEDECHIAQFGKETCVELVESVEHYLEERKNGH